MNNNILKTLGKVAAVVAGIKICEAFRDSIDNVIENKMYELDYSTANYGKAVKAIMDSDMFDYNKKKAISALKRDEECGYYAAVISIIESDMFDYNKIDTITKMSE